MSGSSKSYYFVISHGTDKGSVVLYVGGDNPYTPVTQDILVNYKGEEKLVSRWRLTGLDLGQNELWAEIHTSAGNWENQTFTSRVKELRERTGAGMMDCKKELMKADGVVDQAIINMRKPRLYIG